jgi:hypothetical protein
MGTRGFFVYPQAMWISLWITVCDRIRKARRCAPEVALANL